MLLAAAGTVVQDRSRKPAVWAGLARVEGTSSPKNTTGMVAVSAPPAGSPPDIRVKCLASVAHIAAALGMDKPGVLDYESPYYPQTHLKRVAVAALVIVHIFQERCFLQYLLRSFELSDMRFDRTAVLDLPLPFQRDCLF